MKYLKKFNEDFGNDNLDNATESVSDVDVNITSFVTWLRSEYPNIEIKVLKESGMMIEVEIEKCDIEPEVGSYVDRTSVLINLNKIGDEYIMSIDGVTGQYGCDEEEDDSFEPELDWTMNYTSIRSKIKVSNFDTIKSTIKNKLDEYLK